VSTALTTLLVATGALAATGVLYLLTTATAAFAYRPGSPLGRPVADPRLTIAVLVPAHDERELIGRCVAALRSQTYPPELFRIVVIADNCTDETADLAAAAGAEVSVRTITSARGKGHALRFAIDLLLAGPTPPDGIVVVDADSTATPTFLTELVATHEAQAADATQADYVLAGGPEGVAALREGAFLLVNRVRAAGRAVLGLPCSLYGNGMLFSRDVLTTHPWGAYTSTEDLEYALRLIVAGRRIAFAGSSFLEAPLTTTATGARTQQLRWEGGKLHLARTMTLGLVQAAFRTRRPALLAVALDVALPPLGLLAAACAILTAATVTLAATGVVAWWAVVPAAVSLGGIPAYVLVGFRAGRAPARCYRGLLHAPAFVLRKVAQAPRLLGFDPESWVRTERPGEALPPDETPEPAIPERRNDAA
jgi:hypothetical protein